MIINTSIWGALQDQANNFVFDCVGTVAPTNGISGTGANITGPGSTYINLTTGIRYVNVNTKASPTWVQWYPFTSVTLTTPIITNPSIAFLSELPIPAGTDQASATAITIGAPGLLWVVGADGVKGVRFSVATVGMVYFLKNDESSNAILNVYPAVGGQINALAANAAMPMPAKSGAIFMCLVATLWVTIPMVPS